MKHAFLDQYSDRNSFMHRLDPRTKFIVTLVFILAVILTLPAQWEAFILYFVIISILIGISRVPVLYVLKRSLLVLPFVIVIAISLPFFKEDVTSGSYNIGLLRVSVAGLQVFYTILVKAWLSALSLILLTATTKVTELFKGLEQMHFPRVMIMILTFMYRYIFVITDEVMRMKQARDSRNFGGRHWWQIKTIGNMIGTLFIRSYEHGERVYTAMLARGYDGQSRVLNRLNFKAADGIFGIGLVIALLASTTLVYIFH
ncbi:MAG: cobalt ECF transporter T component CbiQ [Dehalococcoidales bacterium]|nr:cobalt ECF transporter T component CbiQ [Dehalococcoidales bacterium]